MNISDEISLDWGTVQLILLFLVVMGASVYAADVKSQTSPTPETVVGSGSSGAAATGGGWVIVEVIFASVIVGVIFLVRRMPEWVATMAKRTLGLVISAYLGAWAVSQGLFPSAVFAVGILYMATVLLDRTGVWWIINNALAIGLAVYIAVFLSRLFGVTGLLVALVGLTVYDHVFADKEDYMFDMIESMMKYKIPLLFLKPESWRLRWSETFSHFEEAADDERTKDNWAIGMADIGLPAAFAAAVYTNPHGSFGAVGMIPAALVIAGTAISCLRLRHKMHAGGGAGMPSLTVGAIGGWAIAQIVVLF